MPKRFLNLIKLYLGDFLYSSYFNYFVILTTLIHIFTFIFSLFSLLYDQKIVQGLCSPIVSR